MRALLTFNFKHNTIAYTIVDDNQWFQAKKSCVRSWIHQHNEGDH
ncbi:MAG: hypothetical protein ACKPKO_25995 [Candidatus Fonsibacter sp.]